MLHDCLWISVVSDGEDDSIGYIGLLPYLDWVLFKLEITDKLQHGGKSDLEHGLRGTENDSIRMNNKVNAPGKPTI